MGLDYNAYARGQSNPDWDEVIAALNGSRDVIRQHTTIPEYDEMRDGIKIAIAVIRKQKPRNVTSRQYKIGEIGDGEVELFKASWSCPNCGSALKGTQHSRYCSHCGQALAWENGKYDE